tara:strand:+ start:238 stop:1692 length:1455 start_codon:yes stop_codon:yes gene_type:complete
MFNQKGGKYIARGSFGCVYSPNLICDTQGIDIPQDMNKVSKVVEIENLEEEWKPIDNFKLDTLDPENKYFIYPLAACNISSNTISSDKEFYKCDLYKTTNNRKIKEKFANTIQPNGGVVTYKRKSDLNFENNWNLYANLLIGLGILHKNNIYHRDIKEDNIVYSPVGGFRYIDFGLTLGYDSLPLVNNKVIDKEIEFHKQHIREARRAIPQLTVDVDRLTIQIRSNSSKSKMFKKSITSIRDKIKKVKELRLILDGMKAKEQYHREHLSVLLDNRYSLWSDSKQKYFYWCKDFYILNKFLNEKEEIDIYKDDGSISMSKYARLSGSLIKEAEADYQTQDLAITNSTIEKMSTDYQQFLDNVFVKQKYRSDSAFSNIMDKCIETFDIFSMGIFLSNDYKVCTDKKNISRDYREEFKLFVEELLTLNPETRPTIDIVISKYMWIVKRHLIDSRFLDRQTIKFNILVNKIKDYELCTPEQIEAINSL